MRDYVCPCLSSGMMPEDVGEVLGEGAYTIHLVNGTALLSAETDYTAHLSGLGTAASLSEIVYAVGIDYSVSTGMSEVCQVGRSSVFRAL